MDMAPFSLLEFQVPCLVGHKRIDEDRTRQLLHVFIILGVAVTDV